MRELITNILATKNYSQISEVASSFLFENKNKNQSSFYLIQFIEQSKLKGYLKSGTFEELLAIMEGAKKLSPEIEKNTSLILCVESDSVSKAMVNYKNDILFIEEDEYWFKKYVLLYSTNTIEPFKGKEAVVELLNSALLNLTNFDRFHKSTESNDTYYFVIQVFLKLPFLNVPIDHQSEYQSVKEILEAELNKEEISLLGDIIEHQNSISETFWEDIRKASGNTSNDEKILSELFEKFK